MVEGAKEFDSKRKDLSNGLNGPLLQVSYDCVIRCVKMWIDSLSLSKLPKLNPPFLILISKHYPKCNRRYIAVPSGIVAKIHMGCISLVNSLLEWNVDLCC